jgi:hypothetical protein
MEKSKQIITKLAKVKQILTVLPEARDDDRLLIDSFWRYEKPLLFSFQSGDAVMRAFVNGELSMPDDITRARRKVQEQYPELRGTKWRQKQRTAAEVDVRDNINKPTPTERDIYGVEIGTYKAS